MGSLSKTVKTQGCQRKFLIYFFVQLINLTNFDKNHHGGQSVGQ